MNGLEKITECGGRHYEEKYISVSNYIKEMADSSVFPLFIDEGGVYNDEGDYQTYFSDIMDYVEGIGRPSMSFIQTRMMKFALKNKYDRSYHVRINSLSDETAFELISLKLKDLDLDIEEEKIKKSVVVYRWASCEHRFHRCVYS